ncbi:DUF6355 family natural product biosynthesis protein [Nonomuraea sp. NPDC050691]|uniref:DUF6355 family natural product biosynthesis protein n=1 Tax=Nonomuraea sp. NPDC050691 TaxID=3155661 RepID=UPI0033D9C400
MRAQIVGAIGGMVAALALTTAPAYAGQQQVRQAPAAAKLATAGTSGGTAGALACGWSPDGPTGQAWYNHCGPTWVYIRVERHGLDGFTRCVPPGWTHLGSTSVIKYAWYNGHTC